MNEIERAVITSHFPRLKVRINKFKNKLTGEEKFAVMQVNNTHKVYNASQWEMLEEYEVEGTELIQDVFYNDIIKQMQK